MAHTLDLKKMPLACLSHSVFRLPVDSAHKVPVMRKAFPYHDVIQLSEMVVLIRTQRELKVIQNGVKQFLNETVKKSCFHVDL